MTPIVLRLGYTGPEVRELRCLMARAGYQVPTRETEIIFDLQLDRCVRAHQEDRGLTVDGAVVYEGGKTWFLLEHERLTITVPDPSSRAARLSRGLAALYDVERHRMIPEYRQSSTLAWERMEMGRDRRYVVPLSSDGSGRHGATCGHAAWLLTSWWMRAMHLAWGIFPTWRTGRGPTSTMPLRFLPLAPVAGVMYGGALHRGLVGYVKRIVRVSALDWLGVPRTVAGADLCQWYICQRDSGHIVCVLRVDEGFGCVDPRIGLPAVPGLYRLAADGSKASVGRPWTWRRVRPDETGPWTAWGMADLPASGEIEWGPLAGAPDLPLVLE